MCKFRSIRCGSKHNVANVANLRAAPEKNLACMYTYMQVEELPSIGTAQCDTLRHKVASKQKKNAIVVTRLHQVAIRYDATFKCLVTH